MDRHAVVHAEAERRRVHDPETALDRLEVRDLGDELGRRVSLGVGAEDAVVLALGHEDGVGVELEGAQRRRRVGAEVRVAGAGGADDDAALVEVTQGAAADVRLADRRISSALMTRVITP